MSQKALYTIIAKLDFEFFLALATKNIKNMKNVL